MTSYEIYQLPGPYPYLYPLPPASSLSQDRDDSSPGPSSSNDYSTKYPIPNRPKIHLNTSHDESPLDPPRFPSPTMTGSRGVYSSYSALSPIHAKDSPRTIYSLLPAAGAAATRSNEDLPSPNRPKGPIPISCSYTHLPLTHQSSGSASPTTESIDNQYIDIIHAHDYNQRGQYLEEGGVDQVRVKADINSKASSMTMNGLMSGLSNRWGTWKKAERARLQMINQQRMSNGTANFYYPPEEQEWDPKAVKRLSRTGVKV